MLRRLLSICVLFSLVVFAGGTLLAQDPAPVDTLWMDNFDDTATDSLGLVNVGWIRFSEEDGLTGSMVKQTADGNLYMLAGSFQVVGAVVAETNGVPFINPLDIPTSDSLLKANNFSDPNQVFSFQFNLFNMRPGSVFLLATRMPQDDTTDATLPASDPTEQPAYALMMNPNTDSIYVAKYEGSFAALNPSTWTYFGAAPFTFEADIWYSAKFYLHEGKLKAKVWEGDPIDEPADWMIVAEDPNPRVTGKFSMFAVLGAPPGGDEVLIDNVLVEGFGETTAVHPVDTAVPKTFALEQNYPNPFNPETTIRYSLTERAATRLEIYSLIGRRVRTLVSEVQPPGTYRIVFDGRDDFGRPLPSGVYFYRLTSGRNHVAMKKMLLMK